MNSINERQNDDDCLALLYGQRITYDKARMLWYIYFLIIVFNEIIVYVFSDKYHENISLVSIVLLLINLVIAWRAREQQNTAVEFQNEFDRRVFGFKDNKLEILLGELKLQDQITIKGEKKCFILNKKHLADESLKNWYSDVSLVKHENTAIFLCQLECIYWSKKLVHRLIVSCIVFLFIVLALAFLVYSSLQLGFVIKLLVSSPTIVFLFNFSKKLIVYYDYLKKIEQVEKRFSLMLSEKNDMIEEEEVLSFQAKQNKLRQISILVPNWFYWRFRETDQLDSQHTTDALIKKIQKHRPELLYDGVPRFILA